MNFDQEESELININFKELNNENYSLKKHKYRKSKGKRPHSPWWYLIGRIERRYYNKDCKIDFSLEEFSNLKLNKKKKDVKILGGL